MCAAFEIASTTRSTLSACVAISSFTEGESFGTMADDTVYAEDVTTLGERRLALAFVYAVDDAEILDFTGETGGDWTVGAGCYTQGESTGSHEDSFITLESATMLDAGTISGGSFARNGVHTDPGNNGWCIIAFALIPSS